MMPTNLRDRHALLVSVVRLGRGWYVDSTPKTAPKLPLELFEFEACPYCRKVREVMTELDLSYICRPCAKGSNNRKHVIDRGGKAMFPYLVDPNTGREMYESEDIITYLMTEYGPGRGLASRALAPLNTAGASVATMVRPLHGLRANGGADRTQPELLLEVYGYEASPFCRKVRETLHELNLDHRVANVGKKSARRPELVSRGGTMQVPYLVDPNTGTEMYESEEIMRYLHETYGVQAAL